MDKDPFDEVLKALQLYQEIQDMAPIPVRTLIPVQQGNPNEVPCRVQVRDDAGNLHAIADVPEIQLQELRWGWALACIKSIHPTPNSNHIRAMDFILDLNGTVDMASTGNQTGIYPARCRIPPSAISSLPLQERLWRAEKFALGALLYEIFTSHKPFEGQTFVAVQACYKEAEFPEDLNELPILFQSLLYSCWSAEFGRYIILGKFQRYVQDSPARFALQVVSATVGVAGLITIPVLGAIGFGALGPVGGSLAAGWQASAGAIEAGSLFAFCQSAVMGGAAASGLIGAAGSASTAIAAAASRLPVSSSLRATFIRRYRRG